MKRPFTNSFFSRGSPGGERTDSSDLDDSTTPAIKVGALIALFDKVLHQQQTICVCHLLTMAPIIYCAHVALPLRRHSSHTVFWALEALVRKHCRHAPLPAWRLRSGRAMATGQEEGRGAAETAPAAGPQLTTTLQAGTTTSAARYHLPLVDQPLQKSWRHAACLTTSSAQQLAQWYARAG